MAHTQVNILVEIKLNEEGDVKTLHRPLSDSDRAQMAQWPSGGLVQVAHALFVESLRRESYTMAITQLSAGKKPEELSVEEVEQLVKAHVIQMMDQFAAGAAQEALEIIRS